MKANYCFYNSEGQYIELTFSEEEHSSRDLDHVWVICRYREKWLLTNHKERGFEFPGGKIEPCESARKAVSREVFEETGGIIETFRYIGFYQVTSGGVSFKKGIYYATIEKIEDKEDYLETNGPLLVDHLSKEIVKDSRFSFIMKDDVLLRTLEYIEKFNVDCGGRR